MRSNVRFLRYALLMLMIVMGVAALPRLAAAQTLNILNAATRVDYSACPIAIADPTVPSPCPTVTVLNTLDILEDTSGAVQIQADMFGWGWSVNISGFPPTWSVAPGPGVYNAATGVWSIDLTPYVGGPFTGGPVVTPPLNSDVDLTGLVVTLVDSGGVAYVTDTLNIIVDAVADTPVVTATNGVQPTAGAVAGPAQGVSLSVALVDTDGSEDFCFVMAGLPPCATDVLLIAPPGFVPVDSSGTPVGTLFTAPNMWQIPASSVAGLQIRPPAGYVGTQNFTLMATTMEVRPTDSEFEVSNNISSPASANFSITWGPPPPPPPPLPPPPPPGTACDGPGPGGSTTGSIANWDNVLRTRWGPTFVCMTHQLSVSMMTQLFMVGAMLDAKAMLETQRLYNQMGAEAHKDYQPSAQMCTFGTGVRGLANSEELSNTNAVQIYTALMRRMTLSSAVSSATGPDGDKNNRLKQFADRYCDLNDNNNQLEPICTNGSAPPARRNKDIDYTRTLENVYTLDIDMATTAGAGGGGVPSPPATKDEEDILALSDNLFAYDVFSFIPPNHVGKRYSNDKIQEMRSVNAMRSVALNSFSHIVAMRAQGSAGATTFLKRILIDMGLSVDEVHELLGQRHDPGPPPVATPLNLSYFAQMEILTKKMLQSPEFYTNLYDTPENVKRTGVALQAFKLMNDRDRYESALRREMLISLLLELNLREAQTAVDNAVLTGVSQMYPKR